MVQYSTLRPSGSLCGSAGSPSSWNRMPAVGTSPHDASERSRASSSSGVSTPSSPYSSKRNGTVQLSQCSSWAASVEVTATL